MSQRKERARRRVARRMTRQPQSMWHVLRDIIVAAWYEVTS